MELDEFELTNLRTNRTEMPANFQNPEKWDLFVQSYRMRGTRPVDEYKEKMKEIEKILLDRFLKARNGDDKEEELRSRNDLLEWLVAYDFSLARVKVRKVLQYKTEILREEALSSVIIPVIDLTKKIREGKDLSSNSLAKALYFFDPDEGVRLDIYLADYINGAINAAIVDSIHPGQAREPGKKYYLATTKFQQVYGREPNSDKELHDFLRVKKPTLKLETVMNWHVAYSSTKEAEYIGGEDAEDEWYPFPQSQPSPERIVESNEFFDLVDEIVRTKCTPNQKIVWYLRHTVGIGNKEILKRHPELISENNISKNLERAADRIAAELVKKGYSRK